MRIALSGATGFIGRHVLAELREHKGSVVALARDAKKLKDFANFIEVVEMDISHPTLGCYELLGRPDVLIHLAWNGLPNYHSLHHFESELPDQYQFLKGLIQDGLGSLIVTGTCFEYGMQSGPLAADLPTMPTNAYGYAKDALRKQLEYLKLSLPFNLTWARLFYIYGDGQAKTSLYPMLKEAVRRGDKVFRMSGGEQLRDYLHVTKIAMQIVNLAMENSQSGLINICSGQPVSVRQLVEQWLTENNWKIKLELGHYPYPDYEPMAFWGSGVMDSDFRHLS